nr:hypothetical protein [Fodinibius halophilus]
MEKKKKLGGVGYLINGNMCLGIYEDLLVARIGESLAKTITSKPGIEPYLPDNDDFNDFVSVDKKIYSHSKALTKFIEESISYTGKLPPKEHDRPDMEI